MVMDEIWIPSCYVIYFSVFTIYFNLHLWLFFSYHTTYWLCLILFGWFNKSDDSEEKSIDKEVKNVEKLIELRKLSDVNDIHTMLFRKVIR